VLMAYVYFLAAQRRKNFQMTACSLECFRKILKLPKKSKF